MKTFGEIKTEISSLIARGTTYDAEIFGFTQKALQHIERKRRFGYMYHLFEVKNDPTASEPRTLSIPNRLIREIQFIRVEEQEGSPLACPIRLGRVTDPSRLPMPEEGCPTAYHLAQDQLLIFNNTPLLEYTFRGAWWEFSALANNPSAEHWLFDNFADGVEDLILSFAAKRTRDFERSALLLSQGAAKLDDLIAAEEDKELEDSDLVMTEDFYSDFPVTPEVTS